MAFSFAGPCKVLISCLLVLALTGCKLLEGPVEQNVLNQAIANYSGTCACPFSLDAFGDLCGDKSAYSQGAADAPICYVSEVTYEMIAKYLATN